MYDGIAGKYLLDPETSEWMKDENPYAMMDTVRRMLEAIDRRMWDADPDMREKLEELYMELEGRIEEIGDQRLYGKEIIFPGCCCFPDYLYLNKAVF